MYSGKLTQYNEITSLIKQSNYIKYNHLATLKFLGQKRNLDIARTLKETDNTNLMEGLYIKVEEAGAVKERYKYIREDFILNILNSGGHWRDRIIISNQLLNLL